MYIAPGQGQTGADNPIGSNFFINTFIQSIEVSPLNDFVTVFPIQTYRQPNLTLL